VARRPSSCRVREGEEIGVGDGYAGTGMGGDEVAGVEREDAPEAQRGKMELRKAGMIRNTRRGARAVPAGVRRPGGIGEVTKGASAMGERNVRGVRYCRVRVVRQAEG
jgi:hypothetical protein